MINNFKIYNNQKEIKLVAQVTNYNYFELIFEFFFIFDSF